jgi:hypothetical protein
MILCASWVRFRSVLFFLGCGIGTTLGCEDEGMQSIPPSHPIEITQDTPAACRDYGSDSYVFEYCLYTIARDYADLEEVGRFCSQAGEWEADCRHNWVAARMKEGSGLSTDLLVEACSGNDDCTFELLDFRPDPSLELQLDLCFRYAGRFRDDCGGHAVQRWWLTDPDEGELMRVASLETSFPEKVGYYLGVSVACEGLGSCEGAHSSVQDSCQRHVDTVGRRPERCIEKKKKHLAGERLDRAGDRDPHGAERAEDQ